MGQLDIALELRGVIYDHILDFDDVQNATYEYHLTDINTIAATLRNVVFDRGVVPLWNPPALASCSTALKRDFTVHVLRRYVLQFTHYRRLQIWIQAHNSFRSPALSDLIVRIEIDVTLFVFQNNNSSRWSICSRPHMHNRRGFFNSLFRTIYGLPRNFHIYLSFPYFWRDFRSMRLYARRYLGDGRIKGIRFPIRRLNQHDWLAAQTVAALTDQELPICNDNALNVTRHDHGCRGFNYRRSLN